MVMGCTAVVVKESRSRRGVVLGDCMTDPARDGPAQVMVPMRALELPGSIIEASVGSVGSEVGEVACGEQLSTIRIWLDHCLEAPIILEGLPHKTCAEPAAGASTTACTGTSYGSRVARSRKISAWAWSLCCLTASSSASLAASLCAYAAAAWCSREAWQACCVLGATCEDIDENRPTCGVTVICCPVVCLNAPCVVPIVARCRTGRDACTCGGATGACCTHIGSLQ